MQNVLNSLVVFNPLWKIWVKHGNLPQIGMKYDEIKKKKIKPPPSKVIRLIILLRVTRMISYGTGDSRMTQDVNKKAAYLI